ncbi:hypothetical protein [Streptomyces sp. NPDC086182]|uniref:hypothetical protein n=1 Tax=Streptomyces sp. NPDC086182 TaxID=3155058 RepID=UPI003413BD95
MPTTAPLDTPERPDAAWSAEYVRRSYLLARRLLRCGHQVALHQRDLGRPVAERAAT